jgi:hypothetical protein
LNAYNVKVWNEFLLEENEESLLDDEMVRNPEELEIPKSIINEHLICRNDIFRSEHCIDKKV